MSVPQPNPVDQLHTALAQILNQTVILDNETPQRQQVISFKVSVSEKQQLEQRCEGINVSEYIRAKLFDHPLPRSRQQMPSINRETLSDSQFAEMGTKFFASIVVLSRLTGEKAKITSSEKRIKESELNEQVEHFLNKDIHQYSYFIARHHDKEHQHIHIVASRLNEITGKAIQTWQNYPKGEYAARILEKQFLLTSIECSWHRR